MPSQTYERYGLTGNPFRDLASEGLEDVGIFHVNQEVDDTLRTIREEVYDKENRALVGITGPLGAGKTERLLLTAAEGRERGAFTVYYDLTSRAQWVLHGLAGEVRKTAELMKLAKTFSYPPWLRAIGAMEKAKDVPYDPREAGRILAAALNDRAPSVLLLNDLHNLAETTEVDVFVEMLQETVDAIRPGVLVMFSAYASYVAWLSAYHPAFATRINRTFLLAGLSDDEAALVLAKKMLAKRVVEDLDPTFPFDPEAVKGLNRAAAGNPRRLLELADLALEYAITHRAYRIDGDVVETILVRRQNPPSRAERPTAPETQAKGPPATSAVPPTIRRQAAAPGGQPPWSESQ
jgi:hypothetical protein